MDNKVLIERIEEIKQSINPYHTYDIEKFISSCTEIIKNKTGNEMIFELGKQFVIAKEQVERIGSNNSYNNRVRGMCDTLTRDIKKANELLDK